MAHIIPRCLSDPLKQVIINHVVHVYKDICIAGYHGHKGHENYPVVNISDDNGASVSHIKRGS